MTVDTSIPRTRRSVLGAAIGGLAGLVGGRLAVPDRAEAAAGSTMIIGSEANNAGTANTQLLTNSSVVAFKLLQNGPGTALMGYATPSSGPTRGVYGRTDSPAGFGVQARNAGAAGSGAAIQAIGLNNDGLVGTSDNADRYGVKGSAPGIGVYGVATSTTGQTAGVVGVAAGLGASAGVLGLGSDSAAGVKGFGGSGPGLEAHSNNTWGAYGHSTNSNGVVGGSTNGNGVVGFTTGGDYAGYFEDAVHVNGTLTKAAGSFKIDHPLDPARKYLSHSFVESPDMLNVYSGTAVLDAKGEATVTLPGYFETLNRDVRYQLTAVGSAAPDLHVRTKVAKGRFRIAGGTAGQEVCWQVTGIRQDAYAAAHRIVVEEAKPPAERGLYLHPELYGQPVEKGRGYRLRTRVMPAAG